MIKQISDKLKEKKITISKERVQRLLWLFVILKYYITDPTRIKLNVVNYWPIFRHYGGQRLNRLKPQFITAHATDIHWGGSALLSLSEINRMECKGRTNQPVSYNKDVTAKIKKKMCVFHCHGNIETPRLTHTHTHWHRYTIAQPAHTSVWPHSHLKRFHLLTARPVFLPADVFWGQCFFEKQTERLRQQEKTYLGYFWSPDDDTPGCTFQEFPACAAELFFFCSKPSVLFDCRWLILFLHCSV